MVKDNDHRGELEIILLHFCNFKMTFIETYLYIKSIVIIDQLEH